MDRRVDPRIDCADSVFLTWVDQSGKRQQEALLLNISRTGARVHAPHRVPVGTHVEIAHDQWTFRGKVTHCLIRKPNHNLGIEFDAGCEWSYRAYWPRGRSARAGRDWDNLRSAHPSYTVNVARGWESKSVQDQIDAAKSRHGDNVPPLTMEQLDQQKKRESLLLHRTRVLRDLEGCKDDRYRKTLTDGLAYLETQLTGLGWTP